MSVDAASNPRQIYPTNPYTRYTFQQIVDTIAVTIRNVYNAGYSVAASQTYHDLAYAIAYKESGLNPNAAGDWVYADGSPAPAGVSGAHPRSIGLYQTNREGGLGSGYSLEQLVDPTFNAAIDLTHLAQTPQGNLDPGQWAAESQRPSDRVAYAADINSLLKSKPWQNLTNNDIANPGPGEITLPGPGFPISVPLIPGITDPIQGPDPSPGGGTAPDPNTTGSGLPDLITADPIVLGEIPGLGKVTLDLTPILNWGLRLGLTLVGGGLIVYGVIVLSKPALEGAAKIGAEVAA